MTQSLRTSTTLRKVLVATDFSEASARARDYALALADPNATLVFTHAHLLPLPDWPDPPYVPDWMPAEPSVLEGVRERLRLFAAPARAAGFSVETILREGLPADVILEEAASLRPDLIAIGTHGRRGFERWLMGSTAERVVRLAAVPVLTASAVGPKAPSRIRAILCPQALGAPSESLAFASAVADRCGSALTVLHVLKHPVGQPTPGWLSRRAHEEMAQALSAVGRGPDVSHLVRHGRPSRQVLQVALEQSADVIVMGAHDRPTVQPGFLGSTADHVLRESPCAVITVPPARERNSCVASRAHRVSCVR